VRLLAAERDQHGTVGVDAARAHELVSGRVPPKHGVEPPRLEPRTGLGRALQRSERGTDEELEGEERGDGIARETEDRPSADLAERDRLEEALRGLGKVPETQPPLPQPPVPGALEVFSSVWLLQDDSALAVKLPENELAFVDGTGWYKDQARKQPREGTYPKGFVPVVVAYLNKNLNDMSATRTRVEQEMSAAQADLTSLQSDAVEYEGLSRSGTTGLDAVDYGTSEIPLGQALQRTYADLGTTQQRIADLRRQLDALPGVELNARKFLDTLKQQGIQ
jgi:hypothetical protein